MTTRCAARLIGCALSMSVLTWNATPARAQTAPGHIEPAADPASEEDWHWKAGANVFFGFNYQHRKFRDFSAWESQNWIMAEGERRAGTGSLRLSSMFSLEAVTIQDLGSPQVFQTGETFAGAPLIDYQHPHDLIMGLGADYRWMRGALLLIAGADVVGSPTVGPPAFMHRSSADGNPQAPLAHHHMDSTHTTPGVIRGGIERAGWRAEASWFRGREPDENRLDLDLGALDSYAARVSWTRGPWSAQVSGARLTKPEAVTPYDADKLSASLAFTSAGERTLAWLFAFGQKREIHGNLEAYLLEGRMRATQKDTIYLRAESVSKDILDVGFHAGVFHRHRQSQVGALTVGYLKRILSMPHGSFGLGADVTGYTVPGNLREGYGSPVSFHFFGRYRLGSESTIGPAHLH